MQRKDRSFIKDRGIVVLSAVRTAIGKFGGALKDTPPSELAASVIRESVQRAGVSPSDIGHVVIGNVIHTDAKDMYLARVAALRGGLPIETPAFTVNRVCGSGLQAILTASEAIVHGDVDVAIGGGAESMSRAPYWLPALRWGARLNDTTPVARASVDLIVKDNYRCYLRPDADGRLISIYAIFGAAPEAADPDKLAYINRVNDQVKLIRASVSANGKFFFDYYLSVEGGISKRSIVMAVRRFFSCLGSALREDTSNVVA